MKQKTFYLLRSNSYISSIILLILMINIIMYYRDFRMMNLDNWVQIIEPSFLYHDFLKSILYYHGNPPGLSIIYYLAEKISFGNRSIFFEIIFPILHCICFSLFYKVLVVKKIHFRKVIAAILFLNPLIFVYFKFPFYSSLIFVSSCFLLYVWTSEDISANKRLLYTAIILSFNGFLRSSWHIVFILLILAPFFVKANNRYRIISLLILIIPLSVYIKNYIVFHKFVTSSWTPMNLARAHIPWECDCKTISKVPAFSPPQYYQPYITKDPLQEKYKDIPILNRDAGNNVILFAVGDMYTKDLKKCFSIEWSLRQVLQGIFYFYRSPVDYAYLKKRTGGILEDNVYFCYDFFNINENPGSDLNPLSKAEMYFKNLSIYTFIYIFIIIYFIVNIKRLTFNERLIFIIMVLYSGIYATTDFYESNRMRFEIEPFYYFFVILGFNSLLNKKVFQDSEDQKVDITLSFNIKSGVKRK